MLSLATNRSVQAVAVEVGGDDSEPAAVAVDDARLGGHVDEPPVVVAEEMVRQRRDRARVARDIDPSARVLADHRVLGVPDAVVADVEVEVAVVVEVGEGRRRRPVAVARQAGPAR